MQLEQYIRDIHDFPKQGVLFKDITPLLQNAGAFSHAIQALAEKFSTLEIDCVVGIEARGYVIGAPLAFHLGLGFVPIRKTGKLPWETLQVEYDLEYGTSSIEVHRDGMSPGDKVLVIDDVLATGGTLEATIRLVEQAKANVVGIGFLLELEALDGRTRLDGYRIETLMSV
jgi:adenine phosphoribosyltransferase